LATQESESENNEHIKFINLTASTGKPPGQTRASTSTPTSGPRKPLPSAASQQTPDPNLQGKTSLELSTEDNEMIGLGDEDSTNSENIDPNVQAQKKSASLSRPLSSASNWASKNPSAFLQNTLKETAKSGTYCH
jgi:hypothetical protein